MNAEHRSYHRFTTRSRLDKAVNSLLGLIEGVAIDSVITPGEVKFLQHWMEEHELDANRHPFNELLPVVRQAMQDGVVTEDERADIVFVCNALKSTAYYDTTTADIQRLHAVVGAIAADGTITESELRGLRGWLDDHAHLRTCWPYDEIDSLVTMVLADGRIDAEEHRMLGEFFTDFLSIFGERTVLNPLVAETSTTNLGGLCAVCPEIAFTDTRFCFTGASTRYSRAEMAETVRRLGGDMASSVNKTVKYLVIGADGNPCWAYACYGRKVEEAVRLRKNGVNILVVHEHDFHGAVQDHGRT